VGLSATVAGPQQSHHHHRRKKTSQQEQVQKKKGDKRRQGSNMKVTPSPLPPPQREDKDKVTPDSKILGRRVLNAKSHNTQRRAE
jgi:hypothetical protein